jgi:outer membrane protein assembly factor BamB
LLTFFILFYLLLGTVFIPSITSTVNADSSGTRTGMVTQFWTTTLNSTVVKSPVVANGLVYVTSQPSGSAHMFLYCINASSGMQIWSYIGEFISFAVANDNVYVSESIIEDPFNFQGVVSCLKASNGTPLWSHIYGLNDISSVAVVGDYVFLDGYNYTFSTGKVIGFVYALDSSTGTVLWSYSSPMDTRFNSLEASDDHVFAVSAAYSEKDSSWQSAVYTFDINTGRKLWNYTTSGQFSSFVVDDQKVYVSSNFMNTTGAINSENNSGYVYSGGILALNASNGIKMWDYPIDSSVDSPIIVNGMVYAVAGSGSVYSFDALNGKLIWHATVGSELGSAFLINGYLYAGSSAGVYCFDAANGHVIWSFAANDYADSSATYPTTADKVIYVGWNGPISFAPATQHNFYALDALSGKNLWNYTLGYTILFSPSVVNDTVYIGSTSVTSRSPDYEGPGAVVALNSTFNSLPSLPTNDLVPILAITIGVVAAVAVLLIILIVYIRKRKTHDH